MNIIDAVKLMKKNSIIENGDYEYRIEDGWLYRRNVKKKGGWLHFTPKAVDILSNKYEESMILADFEEVNG